MRCNQFNIICLYDYYIGGAMFWTLSFELLPGEKIIDDTDRRGSSGIRSVYSVFLTNMRTIFRFDGLGSSLSQSFFTVK
jgi:hypothetical protein